MSRAFIPERGQGRGPGDGEAFPLAEKVDLDHQKLFDISSRSSGPRSSDQCRFPDQPSPGAGTRSGIACQLGLPPGSTAEMMLKNLKLAWSGDGKLGDSNAPGSGSCGALHDVRQ